ncbi:MAG: metallophosphoesterase [Candidatus Thorarchaeota archaeon]|nr:MAG: metallophosphoesterase [Candidatus Thorarchaeota archaeon]
MKVLAVADVHSPRFHEDFVAGLKDHDSPDLLLMAGDMVNRGRAAEYSRIVESIGDILGNDFPIIACFGNDDYGERRAAIIENGGDRITFLDEKSKVVETDGLKVGIVGTQGSLDKPTSWQRKTIPSIKRIFAQRASRAESLLRRLKEKTDYRILLMHYAPCLETCEGESARSFAWLGSRKFYSVIKTEQPDLVIHGHVHNATTLEAKIGDTMVYNVAFPAVGSLTKLEIQDGSG